MSDARENDNLLDLGGILFADWASFGITSVENDVDIECNWSMMNTVLDKMTWFLCRDECNIVTIVSRMNPVVLTQ